MNSTAVINDDRNFTTSALNGHSTVPRHEREFDTLRVNGSRLIESLHQSCEYGKAHAYGSHPTETGMARLALNDDDKLVRQWFVRQAEAVGCKVTIDQMGNIFAVRPGKHQGVAPIMMGSHLDTQPTGGRYDGILGVLAGLEVLRTLHENNFETQGPVGIVDWTNEEGSRFPIVTIASGVWAENISLDTAWSCEEISPSKGEKRQTLKEELKRIGFLGGMQASWKVQPIAAHFELHIEQGPILEDEKQKIGVVTGAQAYRWYEVEVRGRDSHAGTTPFGSRKDALLAAAKMIVASNEIAKDHKGLVTTGIMSVEPGSTNTIAHTVKFTLDIRHPDDGQLSEIVNQCSETFSRIAKDDCERGVSVRWRTLAEHTAVQFHKDCIKAVTESADEVCSEISIGKLGDKKLWREMLSGASHDSCQVSTRCPTAMIFTPTKDGMSHTPDEYCSPEDCILGAQVLLGAVLRYDAFRSERGDFIQ